MPIPVLSISGNATFKDKSGREVKVQVTTGVAGEVSDLIVKAMLAQAERDAEKTEMELVRIVGVNVELVQPIDIFPSWAKSG